MDFDACRNISEDEFETAYSRRLAAGWAGFSGRLVKLSRAHPQGVPDEYVMQPFEVKIAYFNHPWCTVDLEVSYNEVGDADEADLIPLPDDVRSLFSSLGLPEPKPVPLMRISHQFAQKLHGVTDRHSIRVQDLIDLQLMAGHEKIDFSEVNAICRRLFANRKRQPWPCEIVPSASWREAYETISRGMEGVRPFDEALKWGDGVIAEIATTANSKIQST